MGGPIHRPRFWPQKAKFPNKPNPTIGQSPATTEVTTEVATGAKDCLPHTRAVTVRFSKYRKRANGARRARSDRSRDRQRALAGPTSVKHPPASIALTNWKRCASVETS
jgi:hypothetical protein